ncbi:hypothetical protein EVAR_65854_1 [Eumeta japonica]|uniref:Uncharacterized protein n=1 Tax=Eumeta variegata TaxID=151549 RepID=A0A4C1SUJ3_EUMVA|nr:hypothetical protein EVAR_65854_1 [Eumeta japonica]
MQNTGERWSSPSMGTRNPKEVTSLLPASWVGLRYVMVEEMGRLKREWGSEEESEMRRESGVMERESATGTFTHCTKLTQQQKLPLYVCSLVHTKFAPDVTADGKTVHGQRRVPFVDGHEPQHVACHQLTVQKIECQL